MRAGTLEAGVRRPGIDLGQAPIESSGVYALDGVLAAVLAMLVTLALVVVELTDAGQRHWWAAHPLTTDTVAGLLVLLVTVLVVNRAGHPVRLRAGQLVRHHHAMRWPVRPRLHLLRHGDKPDP
jgi:uncharacterized membrane protein